MKSLYVISLVFIWCLNTEAAERGHHKELSDVDHKEGTENHDIKYDHEAFLGKEESAEFDKLTLEESKKRLKKIIEKIDVDNDGKVTEDELRKWILFISRRYISKDRDRRWNDVAGNRTEHMTLEFYLEKTYGKDPEYGRPPADIILVNKAITTDKRRWKLADQDGDKLLSFDEFLAFTHPNDFQYMKEALVEEVKDDIDTSKDGYIDLEEFMTDLWNPGKHVGESIPDWVELERTRFSKDKDTDGDGKMDDKEIAEWLMPNGYDPIEAETAHLIYHTDKDKDKHLSLDEIMEKHEIFVGSQATNYGDALKHHEDL